MVGLEAQVRNRTSEIPIWKKMNLTVEEAAAYSRIGVHKIRELMKIDGNDFVISVGVKKKLIKRERFEKYLMMKEII